MIPKFILNSSLKMYRQTGQFQAGMSPSSGHLTSFSFSSIVFFVFIENFLFILTWVRRFFAFKEPSSLIAAGIRNLHRTFKSNMKVKMIFTPCVAYLDRKIFLKSNSFFQVFHIVILLWTVLIPNLEIEFIRIPSLSSVLRDTGIQMSEIQLWEP